MKVISVLNQKGGVAKTTTASALAFAFAEKGFKTLVVDTDAQCNLSEGFCFTADDVPEDSGMVQVDESIYEVLLGKEKMVDAIYQTKYPNLHICPATPLMADVELQLSSKFQREMIVSDALKEVAGDYDYCIIDTPPALGIMTLNVMIASDYIIIPAEAETYSVRGIQKLTETLQVVQNKFPTIKVLGILLARYENISNDKFIKEYCEVMASELDTIVFNTKIRAQKFVKESRSSQTNIIEYARMYRRADREDAGSDYEKFADEVLAEMAKLEGE